MNKEGKAWNILTFSQEGIDTHYLQPYLLRDRSTGEIILEIVKEKEQLRNGQIERAIHGGMHAGRVSLLVLVLNHLFQQCFPLYAQESKKVLAAALGIDVAKLSDLTRAALIYHDTAREDEAEDRWDKESAKNLHQALSQLGESQRICDLFEAAVANKDSPQRFKDFCQANLPELNSTQADYLRKIINLADCFDSIRCRGEFNFYYVLIQLNDIPEYDAEKHVPSFIALGQNLHTVIWDQGDMYFDCKLVLEGKKIPTERSGAHFIRARKVQFEHAPHVVSALAAHVMTYPYFKPMLQGEKLLCTDLATVKPAFDPFIHGTQSGFLTVLKEMVDRGLPPVLNSPLGLVQQMLGPMTGELSRRGANCKLTDSALMCFGRLKHLTTVGHHYTYKKIKIYAEGDAKELQDTDLMDAAQAYFKYYKGQCLDSGFTYVNALMIYYLRAKQLGVPDPKLLTSKDKENLLQYYRHTIDIYYLVMLIHRYLRINKQLMDRLGWRRASFARNIAELFTMNILIYKISQSGLDLKAIYENPTSENLAKLVTLFSVPSDLECGTEPWLIVTFEEPELCENRTVTQYDFLKFSQNENGWGIDSMLLNYVEFYPSPRSVVGIQRFVPEHIKMMEQSYALLKQVLYSESSNFLNDPVRRCLLTRNFPVIIVCEAEEAVNISLFVDQEFRADRPLVFGKDITMIATNTRENALLLRKFLDQNGFANVGVTLFSELDETRLHNRRPKLIHSEEKSFVPSLSWLAAKAVVPGVLSSRKGPSLYDILAKQYSDAEAKYQKALKSDDKNACAQAEKELKYAKARFLRVDRWCDDLEDAQAYHRAFTTSNASSDSELG